MEISKMTTFEKYVKHGSKHFTSRNERVYRLVYEPPEPIYKIPKGGSTSQQLSWWL